MKRKCVYCAVEFETNTKKIYCDKICRDKFNQYSRKNKDKKRYREYLDRQNKKRRDEVRNRIGLPLDHPKINESGKGFKKKDGYIYILNKTHPNCAKSGYVAEHVIVMTRHIGRALNGKETVHHKNGIRDDNRIENLELWSHSHPFGQRVEDKIHWCKEFLDLYGFDVIKR